MIHKKGQDDYSQISLCGYRRDTIQNADPEKIFVTINRAVPESLRLIEER